ncbi:MAG TPA: helix-turn-helix transcriptional regulator [bacterium]|nr:helix-turn-helix transcriptional regulator [bacterium]
MNDKSSPYAEIAVLALLAESPRYGYEIDTEIKNRGINHWGKLGISSIYYLLNKLEKTGYVTFEYQKEGKYPTRKVYSITPAGRTVLEEQLFSMLRSRGDRLRPMIGIAFIHVLPKETALEALRELQQRTVEMEEHYKEHVLNIAERYPFPSSRALMKLWGENIEYMHLWLRKLYRELEAYPWQRWGEVATRQGIIKNHRGEK